MQKHQRVVGLSNRPGRCSGSTGQENGADRRVSDHQGLSRPQPDQEGGSLTDQIKGPGIAGPHLLLDADAAVWAI